MTTPNSKAVDEAIARARAAAAGMATQAAPPPAANQNLPAAAPAAATGTAVAAPVRPGKMLTMADMQGASLNVDAFLKIQHAGMSIADDRATFDEMFVIINMTDGVGFFPKQSIKWGQVPNLVYKHTYDGLTCVGGGSWADAVAMGAANKANPYRSVDIEMELAEEVKGKSRTFPKGFKLGHSTSTTNWNAFESFYKKCAHQGLLDRRVLVKLVAEPKEKGQTKWGIIQFEIIGAADADPVPANDEVETTEQPAAA